jgi:hypothetical protein
LLLFRKPVENIVFAFPRLQKKNATYFDKFTDPLIELSELKNNYLIFQRPESGLHYKPRRNSAKEKYTDFIETTSKLASLFLFPFVMMIRFKALMTIYRNGKRVFGLSTKDLFLMAYKITIFTVQYIIYRRLLKSLRPKNVFVVNRALHYPVIVAAHKMNIASYELQHGVTHTWTVLYSGKYDPVIDPDYFLAFGQKWIGKQYGIPLDKMINIGWAYSDLIHIEMDKIDLYKNRVLVISVPGISPQIVAATILLAKVYEKTTFDLRLHPQEQLSREEENKIQQQTNVILVDNTEESTQTLMRYKYVLGVMSSVLFEALSLQKNVRIINFEPLKGEQYTGQTSKYFEKINSVSDFQVFINDDNPSSEKNGNTYYSQFDVKKFNELVRNETSL